MVYGAHGHLSQTGCLFLGSCPTKLPVPISCYLPKGEGYLCNPTFNRLWSSLPSP